MREKSKKMTFRAGAEPLCLWLPIEHLVTSRSCRGRIPGRICREGLVYTDRATRRLQASAPKPCTYLHKGTYTGSGSGLFHLGKIEPEPKKEFADSVVRLLVGLDLGIGRACIALLNSLLSMGVY